MCYPLDRLFSLSSLGGVPLRNPGTLWNSGKLLCQQEALPDLFWCLLARPRHHPQFEGKKKNIFGYQRSRCSGVYIRSFLIFLVAQLVKTLLQCGRPGFDPWVGKIPQRREWLPTPVFWPGEFHGLQSLWGRKELDMTVTFTFLPRGI